MNKKVTIVYKPTDGGDSKAVLIEMILGDGKNKAALSINDQLHPFIDSINFEDDDGDFTILMDGNTAMLDKIIDNAERIKLIIPEFKNFYKLHIVVILVFYLDAIMKMTAQEIADELNFPDVQAVLTILDKRLEVTDAVDMPAFRKEIRKHYEHINHETAPAFIALIRQMEKHKHHSYFIKQKRGKADE
jgi:hypothetical protein